MPIHLSHTQVVIDCICISYLPYLHLFSLLTCHTYTSVYELNGELQEKKARPESIIEDYCLPENEPSMEVHV